MSIGLIGTGSSGSVDTLYTTDSTVGSNRVATLTDTLIFSGGSLVAFNNGSFIVGDTSLKGSEKILFNGRTRVQGLDAFAGSTAFEIWNTDTSDVKLWDFKNNGDVVTKAVGGLNRFSWYSDSELLFSHSRSDFGNIGIGLNHSYTNGTYYNIVIGANASSNSTNSAVVIGGLAQNRSFGSILVGAGAETEAGYQRPIWIGGHNFGYGWGGDYSIRLGYVPTDNNALTANEVFSINFNHEAASLFGRGNGTFGLVGKTNILRSDAIVDTYLGTGGNTLVVTQHNDKPSTNITDAYQVYADDWNGSGTTTFHIRNEEGDVINLHKSTTGITASTFTANLGTIVTDTSTFDGYTIGQVVKALRNYGLLE